jgi:hypothetical protein
MDVARHAKVDSNACQPSFQRDVAQPHRGWTRQVSASNGALFASVIWSIGRHALIVAGFNGTGPEIITWGETKQVTWGEWDSWGVSLYLPVMI